MHISYISTIAVEQVLCGVKHDMRIFLLLTSQSIVHEIILISVSIANYTFLL